MNKELMEILKNILIIFIKKKTDDKLQVVYFPKNSKQINYLKHFLTIFFEEIKK